MSYLINLNAEEEVQLSTLQQFLHGSKTSAMRWALAQTVEKILPSMLLSNNATMQPPPSTAPAFPLASGGRPFAALAPTSPSSSPSWKAKHSGRNERDAESSPGEVER